MRYIDYSSYTPPANWLRKTNNKTSEMITAWETKNPAFMEIKQNAIRPRHWKELKDDLLSMSNNKCWYCESIVDREHGAIDHFRPKSVRQPEGNYDGYWWLVYDFKNFRFSCTLCNSPSNGHGKHDHFPLLINEKRACQPGADCTEETPMLLDPTVEEDTHLVYYERNGELLPKGRDENDNIGLERARISIYLYYLNKPSTCEKRRITMQTIDNIFEGYELCGSIIVCMWAYRKQPEVRKRMSDLCFKMRDFRRKLTDAISPSSEFSISAATILLLRRGDFEWLDRILFKAKLLPLGESSE